MELLLIAMLITLLFGLLSGYPVALVLAGVSLIYALIGSSVGLFDLAYISALPSRIYGIMTNDLLIAVPLFVFMGVMLERAKIAEELLENMASLCWRMRSGLGLSTMLVGALLAASTGIVGATVVTMGLISLPTMLKRGYSPQIATGTICAAGTLGQIIPPSIVLILLGDQISSAYQTVQMKQGTLTPDAVSIADLFVGALIPGFGLVVLYMLWIILYGVLKPQHMPKAASEGCPSYGQVLKVLLPPLLLIFVVLGSILAGVATATESAAVGAVGAMILAFFKRQLTRDNLRQVVRSTATVSCMVFTILIGAALFTLTFRGFGGDAYVHDALSGLPGGLLGAMLVTMLLMFLLGFFLDFIEIIFVVVPIIAPIMISLGVDPVWLAIMIAINLQTSFLTPPFGFALFYLRGVAPKEVLSSDIYKGIIPFVAIQMLALVMLATFPQLATWLPDTLYGSSEQNIIEQPVENAPFAPDFSDDSAVDF